MALIQFEDFDVAKEEKKLLAGKKGIGAVVSFTGRARDFSGGKNVVKLEFEHYSGMAENELDHLEKDILKKFDIDGIRIIHRIGEIKPGENIVLIVVTAAHRDGAFEACRYAIDELKKKVPIWKKEYDEDGSHWVEGHP